MTPEQPVYRWYHKVGSFLFISVCMLVGLFLLIFPWTDYWSGNFLFAMFPNMYEVWNNMFFRGAVSGIGLANLYISFIELFRLERFVK